MSLKRSTRKIIAYAKHNKKDTQFSRLLRAQGIRRHRKSGQTTKWYIRNIPPKKYWA